VTWRDPATYNGEPVCPRCSRDGWPTCADDGGRWTHAESCARYQFGDLCPQCEVEFADESSDH
jgi:hypothetical protein